MSTAVYRVAENKCASYRRWWHTVFVVMGVTMTVHFGLAQGMASLALGDNTRAATQKSETLKVRGTGHGTSEEDARKDAFRDAIERAVGLYVDAEQAAENDELIRDQILTQSNAYIEKYKTTSTRMLGNGLHEVKIIAEVKKHELTAKVSSVMPPKVISLNDELKRLHQERTAARLEIERQAAQKVAKVVSQEKRDNDAAALITNELANFNPSALMLDIEISSPKPVVQESSSDLAVGFDLKLKLASEKYHKVLIPRLKRVLGQVALRPPTEVSFIFHRTNASSLGRANRHIFNSPTESITPLNLSADSTWNSKIEISGELCELPNCTIFKEQYPSCNQIEPSIWLVDPVGATDDRKIRIRMVGYVLSDACIKALYNVSRKWQDLPPVDFAAELITLSGDVITSQGFRINQDCGWIGWGRGLKDQSKEAFYILPWMATTNSSKEQHRYFDGGYWDANGNFLGPANPRAGTPEDAVNTNNGLLYAESIPFRCSFKVLESELSKASSVRVRAIK